jgi:hypothetical protein
MADNPDFITVKAAGAIIGGEAKPISVATYYRGVKAGIYPPTDHPSPGIARVRKSKLLAALARLIEPDEAAA